MDRLAVIRAESDLLSDTLTTCDAAARVPCCPYWDAHDLLCHLTEVHLFWTTVLSQGFRTEDELEALDKPQRPDGLEALVAARADATEQLITQLETHQDDETAWSWFAADQTVGFTRRMQTYEATIHRVDAQMTAGVPVGPLAADVAAGAVDHCVDVMWLGWWPPDATYEPQSVVELVATDSDDRWLVQLGHITGEHEWLGGVFDVPAAKRADGGEPLASVRGTLNDLALWAWTRGGEVEITGAEQAVAEIGALHGYGIQ